MAVSLPLRPLRPFWSGFAFSEKRAADRDSPPSRRGPTLVLVQITTATVHALL